MPELVVTSIFDDIDARISEESTDEDTRRLWADIRAAFENGGPAAVKAVIEGRVRESRLAVERDLKQTRSVTKSTAPKKKASPAKKAVARKRTAAK
jgi:hypothetical protein